MITIADLKKELSTTELTQLSDLNGTGTVDTTVVDEAINDAIAFISSFLVIPSNPTPFLKTIAVDLAIYELRKLHDLHDPKDRKEIESALTKMGKGTIPTTMSEPQKPKGHSSAFRHGVKPVDFGGFR
ncbi:phage protein Gp36 family protein [Sulfuricurvum sp.]|uniref:phage protein Gp36 family protein n=1 Tax=Sulfuricurvum sp. TaxID=2025608 RepID=UPI00260161A4|nr:phage protein Gp36 family protein [Sulfuricurvum sp.]MDD2267025.1 DUF1320 family protein [Sulfuricurvum sp.]MDD2782641.1 DUF1320 family protein [Sulfuricurvum sp.]